MHYFQDQRSSKITLSVYHSEYICVYLSTIVMILMQISNPISQQVIILLELVKKTLESIFIIKKWFQNVQRFIMVDLENTFCKQGPNVVADVVEKANIQKGTLVFADDLFVNFPILNYISEKDLGLTGM